MKLVWQYQDKPKTHLHKINIVSNRIQLKQRFFTNMFYSMWLQTSDLILEVLKPNLLCPPQTTSP